MHMAIESARLWPRPAGTSNCRCPGKDRCGALVEADAAQLMRGRPDLRVRVTPVALDPTTRLPRSTARTCCSCRACGRSRSAWWAWRPRDAGCRRWRLPWAAFPSGYRRHDRRLLAPRSRRPARSRRASRRRLDRRGLDAECEPRVPAPRAGSTWTPTCAARRGVRRSRRRRGSTRHEPARAVRDSRTRRSPHGCPPHGGDEGRVPRGAPATKWTCWRPTTCAGRRRGSIPSSCRRSLACGGCPATTPWCSTATWATSFTPARALLDPHGRAATVTSFHGLEPLYFRALDGRGDPRGAPLSARYRWCTAR